MIAGGPCEACGSPAVAEVELEPARFGKRQGKKYLVQAALTANLCAHHYREVHSSPSPAAKRARIAAWGRYWKGRQQRLI